MYHIHITVIIAVPWQNVHWLTGRLIFVIDAPVEVLAAAAQGHSHDVEKGPEKSSKSKKEWKRQKDLNKCNCKCDWHVELCSILVTIFTRYCATVSYSITASPCITLVSHLFYPTSSTGMSRCLCLGGSQDLEGLSSLCSTCAHSGQENWKTHLKIRKS